MRVVRFRNIDELAPHAADWDRLAGGVPFRGWAWLSAWWRHYGGDRPDGRSPNRLYTIGVFAPNGGLVGLAPWYLHHVRTWGRVIRFLGLGEVCSDYLDVLSEPGLETQVTGALAEWLCRTGAQPAGGLGRPHPDRWDRLELEAVDAEDNLAGSLVDELVDRGYTAHRRGGPACWRIELPSSWEEYLAMLSKGFRKKLRRSDRAMLATGRAELHTVRRLAELPDVLETLVQLHQHRRQALGEPGSFASRRFESFHRQVMPELLRRGQLHLHWLELDGRPAAVEYQLGGGGVIYAYQAGMDPDVSEHSPGRLASLAAVRRAIRQGYRAFDFLRGDEPYKEHWRARRRETVEIRVAARRPSARWRHRLWLAGSNVKRWMRGAASRS